MQKRFGIGIGIVLILFLAISAFAVRLPTVNGDANEWGTLLNNFLETAHESSGNIKSGYITSAMIIDETIVSADIADNTIDSVDIKNFTIGSIDINTSTINATHIVDATISAIDIASSVINRTHIVDATISAIDIASSVINSTHIVDATILGADISDTAAFNLTSLSVTGTNRTITGGAYGYVNVTGIFFNRTQINLPSISNNTCFIVPINITGIPGGVSCIGVGHPDLGNVTVTGLNSTANNCRVLVCNQAIEATDPPLLAYGAFGLALTLDSTAAGPAG